jgi:DNA invertase Pin-like site-specific DNA recombinase
MKRARAGDPRRAIGYVRASKQEQKHTIGAQRAALEEHCRREGVELVGVYEDQVTSVAPLEERPGLIEAIEALRKARAGVFLVTRRDRIARDVMMMAVIERGTLERAGARVVSLAGEGSEADPDDANAVLHRGIADLFGQYERALIRSRTKAVARHLQAQGRSTGSAPFGYRTDAGGLLVKEPREWACVELVLSMRAKGKIYQAIVDTCDARGFRSRKGTPLGIIQVFRIVQRYGKGNGKAA